MGFNNVLFLYNNSFFHMVIFGDPDIFYFSYQIQK